MIIEQKGYRELYQLSDDIVQSINMARSYAMSKATTCTQCGTIFTPTEPAEIEYNLLDASSVMDNRIVIEFFVTCPLCGYEEVVTSVVVDAPYNLVRRYLLYMSDIFEAEAQLAIYREEMEKKEKDESYHSNYFLS